MYSFQEKIIWAFTHIIGWLALVLFAGSLIGCASAEKEVLTVMTHDSFAVTESVIQQFETQNNARVITLKSGDAGAALNKAILTKQAPLADMLYGVDNTLLTRALNENLFEAYDAKDLSSIPQEFQLDPTHRELPVDYGDVCMNYDRAWFATYGLKVPGSLEDLTRPEYKNLLVVENPATSSTGLAFLLATVAHFGPQGYLPYWTALRANGVLVEDGWDGAYNIDFSGSAGKGSRPLVVSYASSPPAEVVFAEQPPADAPTASIVAPDTCFRQIEFVGIFAGTEHRELARKFVDFMLSKTFQEDMPLQMFMFPVRTDAVLPDVFQKYAQVPSRPAVVTADEITAHRQEWIQAWTSTMVK
jgi:thiamine transport system substrate-binding protein